MADVCRDWLTGQTVDCCFVVIGLVEHIPESFAQYQKQTRLDPVGLPSLLSGIIGRMTYDNISTNYLPTYLLTSVARASSTVSRRIFIFIRG